MVNKTNLIIAGLVLVIVGLIYFNRVTANKLTSKDNTISQALDTLHKFKTALGNQGAYITTITGNRNDILNVLNLKSKENAAYKDIIDSLKHNKNIKSIASVNTINHTEYIHDIDTTNRKVVLTDSINTKWYDAGIHIKNSKLGLNITQRDELLLTNSLKDNKGWFAGSTLTTYAISKNPNTQVTGLTSISIVVDKRTVRIGTFVGPALLINKQGNVSVGIAGGIGLTF